MFQVSFVVNGNGSTNPTEWFSTKMKEIRNFSSEKLDIRNLHFDHFINDDEKKRKEINQGINYNVYKFVPFIFVYILNLFVLLGAFSTDIIRWTQLRTLPTMSVECWIIVLQTQTKIRCVPSHIYIKWFNHFVLLSVFYLIYLNVYWYIRIMCAQSESSLFKTVRTQIYKPNSSLKNW